MQPSTQGNFSMSVESYDPRVTQEADPFFMISRKVVQEIDDPVAGFIWVYLRSMSSTWKVIKAHIQSHFGLSDDKIKKVFAWLNAHNLIQYRQQRLPSGEMGDHEIHVLNGRDYFKPENVQKSTKKSIKSKVVAGGGFTAPPVNRTTGKSGTNINKQSNTDLTKQRERIPAQRDAAPSRTYCPKSKAELVSDEAHEQARKKNLDMDHLADGFMAYAKSRGWKRTDWQAAFLKWVIDEKITTPTNVIKFGNRENGQHNVCPPKLRDYTQERLDREAADEQKRLSTNA
jgi:hypothetical protein